MSGSQAPATPLMFFLFTFPDRRLEGSSRSVSQILRPLEVAATKPIGHQLKNPHRQSACAMWSSALVTPLESRNASANSATSDRLSVFMLTNSLAIELGAEVGYVGVGPGKRLAAWRLELGRAQSLRRWLRPHPYRNVQIDFTFP